MPTLCTFDISQSTLNFPRPFVDRPRLAHGLRELDIGNNADIRVTSRLQNITTTSADCQITPWADTILYSAAADVIALAPGDLDFLTGEHTRDLWNDPNDPASESPGVSKLLPQTSTSRGSPSISRPGQTRPSTPRGLVGLPIRRITSTFLADLLTQWTFVLGTTSAKTERRNRIQRSRVLEETLGFIALNYLDIDHRANLRVNVYVDSVSTTGLIWHIDSWDNTTLYSAGATIIAFN
ncbi:hypothetical protein EDB86DRAFT_942519 [Lactarius hatsudake]|nr:hypothetical protein EDB86DRAFT_942519 [Lactarius hatsudake]